MPQRDWSVVITRSVADQIRWWREYRDLSAQAVADKCTALGLRLSRSTLADLENGRRPHVTVAELLALAAVLDVPPVALIAPLGRQATAEILPDVEMQAWDATRWIGGTGKLSEQPGAGVQVVTADDDSVIMQFWYHDQLVEDWFDAGPGEGLLDKDTGQVEPIRLHFAQALRRHRQQMRNAGLMLPELPSELAYLDAGPTPDHE